MENTIVKEVKPVAVIGLGPAGVTAGVLLKQWGFDPDIYEVGLAGGMVNQTAEIDNYPGFMGGGMDLAMKFDQTARDNKLHIIHSNVKSLTKDGDEFVLTTAKGVFYYVAVIIATGTHYRPYAVPGQTKVKGRGFSRCAICDGPLYRNKDVAVIGGGNSAFEEGIYLASICKSVTLINRRTVFRAPSKAVEMFKSLSNTNIIAPAVVTECDGEGHLESLTIKDPNDESDKTTQKISVNACFIYIGSIPTTQFIQIQNSLDERGYIDVDEDMSCINVPGLFGCGDCINTPLRQVATAVGTGSKAGYSAVRFLNRKGR